MISTRIYWGHLKYSLDHFTYFETDQQDLNNYNSQRARLELLLKYGQAIEKASDAEYSRSCSRKLPEISYAISDNLPIISGPLSLAFAEQVYLPHLQRLQLLNKASLAKFKLATEADVFVLKKREFKCAITLRKSIENYKKANPNVLPQFVHDCKTESELLLKKEELSAKIQHLNLTSPINKLSKLAGLIDEFEKENKGEGYSIKQILDPSKEYDNLSACIDALNLTVIKDRLLEYDNSIPARIKHTPLHFLRFCTGEVNREQERLLFEKKCLDRQLTTIVHELQLLSNRKIEKKEEDDNKARQQTMPYRESLSACIAMLLKLERGPSFYKSDKRKQINKIKTDGFDLLDLEKVKEVVAELRTTVTPHRDKDKWYMCTGVRSAHSKQIFSKFFDDQNRPKPPKDDFGTRIHKIFNRIRGR